MKSLSSDEEYLIFVLKENDEYERSESLSKRIESRELRLVPRSTVADKIGQWFFILLTVAVVAFLLVLLAGVARNLLRIVW